MFLRTVTLLKIIELMKAMSDNGMTGFELEEGDWKLTMKREKKIVAAAQTPVIVQGAGQGTLLQTADVTAVESVSGDKEEKKVSGIDLSVLQYQNLVRLLNGGDRSSRCCACCTTAS